MKKKIIARRMSGDELIEVRLSNSLVETKSQIVENIQNEVDEYFIKDVKLRVYVDKKYIEWIRDDSSKISEDKLTTHDM